MIDLEVGKLYLMESVHIKAIIAPTRNRSYTTENVGLSTKILYVLYDNSIWYREYKRFGKNYEFNLGYRYYKYTLLGNSGDFKFINAIYG